MLLILETIISKVVGILLLHNWYTYDIIYTLRKFHVLFLSSKAQTFLGI